MNAGPYATLLSLLNANWQAVHAEFAIDISREEVTPDSGHPLYGEISALCRRQPASLPFFKGNIVTWCTIAPDGASLRSEIANLRAWILPSFAAEDGAVPASADRKKTALSEAILALSPDGYFRWRCGTDRLHKVVDRLKLLHALKQGRPERTSRVQPTLYQLRVEYSAALLVGNRKAAERALIRINELQLDTATNLVFLNIGLWHHFRDFDRIRSCPDLELLASLSLPRSVRLWLKEVGVLPGSQGEVPVAVQDASPAVPPTAEDGFGWTKWLDAVRRGDIKAAESNLSERRRIQPTEISPSELSVLTRVLDDIYTDETLQRREQGPLACGVAEILGDFIREPEFPRLPFASFYLSFLRVWGALYSGTSIQREQGNVLLELASAALRLNQPSDQVVGVLEAWWKARPSCSQLPLLLDCIELLSSELPDKGIAANLWFASLDQIRETPSILPPSDAAIWRSCGRSLGIDEATISQFLPKVAAQEEGDLLGSLDGKRVAIVCMRTRQAKEAAEMIERRTSAKVLVVDGKVAGSETQKAATCDVVLFVWMATTHAVFRAFDGLNRNQLCYVQGTGPSCIVRSLERWVVAG